MNWIDKLASCIRYCKEQNGLPYCKNCGLDVQTLEGAYKEIHAKGTQEALAKVEEWVKIHKTITKKKYGEFDAGFITALDDLLHHLQQLKDNKEV